MLRESTWFTSLIPCKCWITWDFFLLSFLFYTLFLINNKILLHTYHFKWKEKFIFTCQHWKGSISHNPSKWNETLPFKFDPWSEWNWFCLTHIPANILCINSKFADTCKFHRWLIQIVMQNQNGISRIRCTPNLTHLCYKRVLTLNHLKFYTPIWS